MARRLPGARRTTMPPHRAALALHPRRGVGYDLQTGNVSAFLFFENATQKGADGHEKFIRCAGNFSVSMCCIISIFTNGCSSFSKNMGASDL